MTVQPIPEGYHTITPYLVVTAPAEVIAFLEKAFEATIHFCSRDEQGHIKHAEIQMGNSRLMVGAAHGPDQLTRTMLYLYVEDTDAYYHKALAAGATSVMEPVNQFYGDRNAAVSDEHGNQWWLATRVENLTPEEIQLRAKSAAC